MSSNLNYNQFKNSIKLETKNEGKLITKRDGNKSKFNIHKIFLAVLAALKSSKEGETEQAQNITKIIDDTLSYVENISVEDIQNIVEKTLMIEGFLETAKAYIIYRKEHQDNREFLDLLMEKIKRISVETNKDNANIGHSPASKMYQIGAEASKAYYRKYGIPKKIVKEVVDGFIHLHDEDYFDKTINCLSIPLKKILTNMLKYPLEYTTLANPKRIATASSLAGIILQRISNDVFGGTMLPNLDICFQEMIDEGYLEKPTEKEVQQAMQSLICNLQTLRSRAGNQIPFSSITLGLSSGKYGRMVTKYILEEFIKGDAIGSTFIFPNLTFKLLKGINFEKEDVNYDLYQLALKAAGSRMNPTFTLLDSPVYAKYKPKEVNIMGCADGNEIITYKFEGNLYVESFKRMWDRLSKRFTTKEQIPEQPHLYMDLTGVEIYDTKEGFVDTKRIIRNVSKDWLNIKFSNGRSLFCTTDHPFETNKGMVLAKDLDETHTILTNTKQYHEEKQIFNPEKAWLLGFILCDGCYANGLVSSIAAKSEDDIEAFYIQACKNHFNLETKTVLRERGVKGTYKDLISIKTGKILKYLREEFEGVKKLDRHIPNEVFSWDYESRLSFLIGMIDADGYTDPKSSNIQIGSTNKELALQQMALAQTLNMPSKVYQNHYNPKDKSKIRYKVQFPPTQELIEKLVCKKKKNNYKEKIIEDINTIEAQVVEKIKVEKEDFSYDVTTASEHFEVSGIYSHNCRTFVLGNVNGEEVSEGRGNLFPTTLNLPRIALVSKGEVFNKDLNSFFKILKQKLDIVKEVSDIRLAALNKLKAYDIPYLFGNQIYYNSDKINLQKEDSIKEAMKQGSIAIGFVGLAECVKALIGTHHGETSEALTLARKINEFIREYCDNLIIETGYNWSCYATPAESTINKVFKDRKDFGSIEGVTNRDFYSNSFHIPVYYPCKIEKKITIEGMFHEFNNGGRITYIEFDSPTENNLVGMDKCLKYMLKAGVAYAGINFPLDTCKDCRQRGVFNGTCPNCGGNNIEEVRRISGYLGTTDRVNPSKGAEIKERLAHNGRK